MDMPEKKRQHFVPQFYLRNFGSGPQRRRISLFNIPSAQYVPHASIKNQARKAWFYGQKSLVEKALVNIEGSAAQVISGLIAGSALPAKNTLEYHRFLAFMVLQRTRTTFASDDVIESINRAMAVIFGDDPRFKGLGTDLRLVHPYPAVITMNATLWAWPSLLDLNAKLLRAETPLQFITSDNPVVHYNQFLEPLRPSENNTGLFTKGLQIFLPLSPELTFMLYDGRVYRVGRKSDHEVIQLGRADTDSLNGLQVMSAYSTLYFNQGTDERYVRRLLKSYKKFRIRPGADIEQYSHSKYPHRHLIHIRNVEIRCNLSLSFIRFHRRLRREKLGNRLALLRDDQMYDYLEEFEEAVKSGRLEREDFYRYLVTKGKIKPLASSKADTGKSQ